MQKATAELEQFMAASFGGFRYYGCQFPKCLLWSDSTPRGTTNDARQTWIWFMRLAEGFYLKPVSLSCLTSALCMPACLLLMDLLGPSSLAERFSVSQAVPHECARL